MPMRTERLVVGPIWPSWRGRKRLFVLGDTSGLSSA